ncbi:hypothetical protein Tco_0865302 [Tanacetum coccineum]
MDVAIQVSCIINKLSPSWKDFKHALKHNKEELTLVELGSHLRIEESLRVQDSDKAKNNNVVGPSVVNMVEHNNSTRIVVRFPDPKLKTLGKRGIECIFGGYAEHSKDFSGLNHVSSNSGIGVLRLVCSYLAAQGLELTFVLADLVMELLVSLLFLWGGDGFLLKRLGDGVPGFQEHTGEIEKQTTFLPGVAKISDGIFFGSAGLYFSTSSTHECPMILSAAGVKIVRGPLQWGLVNKRYLKKGLSYGPVVPSKYNCPPELSLLCSIAALDVVPIPVCVYADYYIVLRGSVAYRAHDLQPPVCLALSSNMLLRLSSKLRQGVRMRDGYINELQMSDSFDEVPESIEIMRRMQVDDMEKASHFLLMAREGSQLWKDFQDPTSLSLDKLELVDNSIEPFIALFRAEAYEDSKEDPEMDLDEEEEDPEMDVDDEEEEEPLPASPPPLSPLRTPPHVSEFSSDSDIPVTTTTTVGRPFKGPLSTYEVGEPSSIASALVFSAGYELNQLRQDFGIL